MTLKDRITEDMKAAMRAKESARLSAIRLLIAAIKQREVDERITLGDVEVVSVIEKMLKQRRESILQFEAANRKDLADNEKFEVTVLQAYMPKALTDAEVEAAVMEAVGASGAIGVQEMGKVMALLKPKLAGRADMARVSTLVKSKLGSATK